MAFFIVNEEFYFAKKLESLQNDEAYKAEWTGKTVVDLKAFFEDNGLTAQQHFDEFGWAEQLSANAEFDVAAYFAAKAKQTGLTVEEVIQAFKDNGLTVATHYEKYGKAEIEAGELDFTPGATAPSTLTEALVAYQDAEAAREEKAEAIGEFLEEANYDAANNAARLVTAEGEVTDAQADLDQAIADRSAARNLDFTNATSLNSNDYSTLANVTGNTGATKLTAANVTKTIANALADVKADATAKGLYDALSKAKNDLASDEVKNGSEAAIAKALNDAIVAYLKAGGADSSDGDLAAVRAAFVAQEVATTPNWTAVIDAAADAFVVTTAGNVTTVTLADGGSGANLSTPAGTLTEAIVKAVEKAATAADNRDTLKQALDGAESDFESDSFGALYLLALALEEEFKGFDSAIEEAKEALDSATADAETLKQLVADYDDAAQAAEDAFAVLEELGIESLQVITDGASLGVASEGELFLFSATTALQTATVELEAADKIFLGDKYVLNTTADLSKLEGDAAQFEIFFVEDGVNTKLFIEQTAFGSNAASQELHEITLTGVTVDQVSFADGYITIA